MTVEQLYNDSIRPLPQDERIRLIAIIANDMTFGENYSGEWTEEDMREWSQASLQRFEEEHAEGETT